MAELKVANAPDVDGLRATRSHIRSRAQELHELLADFIVKENITKEGGIILVGWSLGAASVNALLAHAPTFSTGEVNVASYIKYVVGHGTVD